jgi:hypothetical protein
VILIFAELCVKLCETLRETEFYNFLVSPKGGEAKNNTGNKCKDSFENHQRITEMVCFRNGGYFFI